MVDVVTMCLALNVFMESRGEPKKAQYAVLEVVHNRSKHKDFPNDYCSVIKHPNAFSWVKNHKSMKPPKFELESWKESIAVARDFQLNRTNYTKGALYFNHVKLGVRYKTNVKSVKIGQHVFY